MIGTIVGALLGALVGLTPLPRPRAPAPPRVAAATERRLRNAPPAVRPAVRATPPGFDGLASWYGPSFAGRLTADGERYDPLALTAASPWLPFGTRLRVVDLRTGRAVQVRVDDRGPWVGGRVLDLSQAAAQAIGLTGVDPVQAVVLKG